MMKKQLSEFLEIEHLEPSPRLAGRLPVDLAWRYHALPVAEDGKQITVAMADPDDAEARQAISMALGRPVCIVRANGTMIDKLLVDLWPTVTESPLNFVAWMPTEPISSSLYPYAQNLASLMKAHLSTIEVSDTDRDYVELLKQSADQLQADLVLYQAPNISLPLRVVLGSIEGRLLNCLSQSQLIAYNPRWLLRRILLIVRNEVYDECAVNWTMKLAKPSGAVVTVLPITVPVPQMYASETRIQSSLSALLAADDPLGRKLRWIARRFVDREIQATLRLREETPYWQIRCETLEGNYDLLVIAAEEPDRLRRWMLGDLAGSLLSWADLPVLFAKPKMI